MITSYITWFTVKIVYTIKIINSSIMKKFFKSQKMIVKNTNKLRTKKT